MTQKSMGPAWSQASMQIFFSRWQLPAEALDYSSLDETEYAEFIESVQTKLLSSAHRNNYEGALVGLQWYSVTLNTFGFWTW